MSNAPNKIQWVKIAAIYMPLIVGLIFATLGTMYYLESSKTYQSKPLPKYGIIPLTSQEFTPIGKIGLTINSMSIQENYVDVRVQFELEAKQKQVQTFTLQVPHRVSNAYGKITYTDTMKTNTYYDQGEASTEYTPGSDASILSYDFKGDSQTPWYTCEVGFRWHDAIVKNGYSTYELLVPFSRCNDLVADLPGLTPIGESASVALTVYLPEDARFTESIPPPSEVVIDWQNNVGLSSLVFEMEVDFGMTPGWANLPSFKIDFDVPDDREKYNRLIFDSGLFLGIGLQLILAGLFDAVKLRERK